MFALPLLLATTACSAFSTVTVEVFEARSPGDVVVVREMTDEHVRRLWSGEAKSTAPERTPVAWGCVQYAALDRRDAVPTGARACDDEGSVDALADPLVGTKLVESNGVVSFTERRSFPIPFVPPSMTRERFLRVSAPGYRAVSISETFGRGRYVVEVPLQRE